MKTIRTILATFGVTTALYGLFALIAMRVNPAFVGRSIYQLFRDTGCPFLVVANKLDKLKPKEIEPNMQVIRRDLGLSEDTLLIPFSAEKGTGRGELVNAIFAAAKG